MGSPLWGEPGDVVLAGVAPARGLAVSTNADAIAATKADTFHPSGDRRSRAPPSIRRLPIPLFCLLQNLLKCSPP